MASTLVNAWKKKNGGYFDNGMRSRDGCEVCENVGMYMLQKLKEEQSLAEVDIVLYRDDLVLATKGKSCLTIRPPTSPFGAFFLLSRAQRTSEASSCSEYGLFFSGIKK